MRGRLGIWTAAPPFLLKTRPLRTGDPSSPRRHTCCPEAWRRNTGEAGPPLPLCVSEQTKVVPALWPLPAHGDCCLSALIFMAFYLPEGSEP